MQLLKNVFTETHIELHDGLHYSLPLFVIFCGLQEMAQQFVYQVWYMHYFIIAIDVINQVW